MNIINYNVLAEDVANGKTYIIYPGLFTLAIWTILSSIGLLLLVNKNDAILRYTFFLIVFLWPMVIVLNFLIHGYVVSNDQPRLEFALGSLIVGGKITLNQASKISNYFNWPSTWLLEGIFSNVTGLSPLEAPVYLMTVTYLLLGLSLILVGRKIFLVHNLVVVSLLIYAALNPYKILHFCPQVYALALFVLLLTLLLKESFAVKDPIIRLILSVSIITSHLLTSLVMVGIACSIIFFSLIRERKELHSMSVFGITTLILFISWNLNYENLIRSSITEILERPQIQSLPPVTEAKIYEADMFFRLMALYRYISLSILLVCSLLTVVILLKYRFSLKTRFLVIGTGILIGIVLLYTIPGSFFHRLLYFVCTLMSALTPIAILSIRERLRVNKFMKIVSTLIFLLLPLLSHLALLEFLTNNNPVNIITSPYEMSSAIFIAENYDFRGHIGTPAPLGAVSFYSCMLRQNISNQLSVQSMVSEISKISISPLDCQLAGRYVESVYIGEISIVSPRERFIYYMNTLFNDFNLVDFYLDCNRIRMYDNGVYKIYFKVS
jgi:hypothetical protein